MIVRCGRYSMQSNLIEDVVQTPEYYFVAEKAKVTTCCKAYAITINYYPLII